MTNLQLAHIRTEQLGKFGKAKVATAKAIELRGDDEFLVINDGKAYYYRADGFRSPAEFVGLVREAFDGDGVYDDVDLSAPVIEFN